MVRVGERRSSEPRNRTVSQMTVPAGVLAPSWGWPDLFAEAGLAA